MERKTLRDDVEARGIEGYFEEILGVKDHYAAGKKEIALNYLSQSESNPHDILLIGDTRHDYEVAEAIGCACILVAQGHHPFEKLADTGASVQKNLTEVLNLLINP
jgi:phosphoglycolate phosphatase